MLNILLNKKQHLYISLLVTQEELLTAQYSKISVVMFLCLIRTKFFGFCGISALVFQMAATEAGRNNFTDSAVSFVKKYNFDGLDLDWEYPTQRGGSPKDKVHQHEVLNEIY